MSNILTLTNLTRYWVPDNASGHAIVLGPMMALHEALRLKRIQEYGPAPFQWEWSETQAVDDTLGVIWKMTGRWKARRAVTVSRETLHAVTLDVVPRLARFLNRESVFSLWDLVRSDDERYGRVVEMLHKAVRDVSEVRDTRQIEPVLGSKVLHHFFPSVIPVFDTAIVRNAVMRTAAVQKVLKTNPEWCVHNDSAAAHGESMLDYHRYFVVCAQIGSASKEHLLKLRNRFGNGFVPLAPNRMVHDRKSLLWRLDAKIAEYCLAGQAFKEGLLP